MITPEQKKINSDISSKLDVSPKEVEKSLDLYHKFIKEKITTDEPCEIIMPFLGRFFPNKFYLKRLKEDEANNSGG